jgi:hypothetical protein
MIKVLRHGNVISVQNPITGELNEMINVTFVEEGRAGADKGMFETSAFLSALTGEQVGLSQLRTHTHPVISTKIGLFPVGQEFPGHINRGMYSTPQIRQQLDKDARLIDGRPTYFKTWISEKAEDDVDQRMDNNVFTQVNPSSLFSANVGAATVNVVKAVRPETGNASNTDVEGAVYQPANVLGEALQKGQP